MAGSNQIVSRHHSQLLCGVVLVLVVASSCSADSAGEACALGPLFSSTRQRAERAVTELEQTTSVELEDSVSAVVDQVQLLREVSPRPLREPLGVLLAAYGQLVVAFDGVMWNPGVAMTDPSVAAARAAFAETSVSTAADSVEEFFVQRCQSAIEDSNPLFAVTGTTLPLPEVGEEPRLDAAEDQSVIQNELRAIGFLIGETYGVAVVSTEAECIARSLGTTFADARDIDLSDEEYFSVVRRTFVSCGVATPPTTTPDN